MDFDTTPHAVVELDRPRRLEANLWVMRRFRQQTGKALEECGEELFDPTGPYCIELVWAMLASEPDLTVEDVGRLLTGRNINLIAQALAPVLKEFMPEGAFDSDPLPETPAPVAAPAESPSTSTSSGPGPGSSSDSPAPSSGG